MGALNGVWWAHSDAYLHALAAYSHLHFHANAHSPDVYLDAYPSSALTHSNLRPGDGDEHP